MVKLTTLIAEREKRDGLYFAVEYFPPRTADGLTKLYERSARIATQGERPARRPARGRARARRVRASAPIPLAHDPPLFRRLAPTRSACLPPLQARCTRT